jgi:hypothetical protein
VLCTNKTMSEYFPLAKPFFDQFFFKPQADGTLAEPWEIPSDPTAGLCKSFRRCLFLSIIRESFLGVSPVFIDTRYFLFHPLL